MAEMTQEVEDRIKTVTDFRSTAIGNLLGGWWDSTEEINAANAIKAIPIDDWAKRGREAAKAKKEPKDNGWPGWIKAGQSHLDTMAEIEDMGRKGTIQNIVQSVKELPMDVVRAPKVAVKATATAVKETTGFIGESLLAGLKPLLVPIAILGIAGLVVFMVAKKARE